MGKVKESLWMFETINSLNMYQLRKEPFGSLQEFKFIKNLGKNSLSEVFLMRHSPTSNLYAVKRIQGDVHDEILIHKALKHPNIIELLQEFNIHKDTFLVMEYASRGNLFQLIRKGQLLAEMIRPMFKSIVEAVLYLHDKFIIHRDIKNILLNENLQPKLCDFGWSVESETRKTFCGTFEYMAPEILRGEQYNFSILLYEMIQQKAPFAGRNYHEIKESHKRPIKFSKKFSSQEMMLIKKILVKEPHKRPSLKGILMDPYFGERKTEIAYSSGRTTSMSKIDFQEPEKMRCDCSIWH